MSSPFPTNSFQLPFGVKTLSPYPVDYWSGPFTGDSYPSAASSANQQIPVGVRFISMGVRLVVDDIPKMYWYSGGTADSDLVEFIGEGSGSQGFQGFQGPPGSGEGSGSQGFQGFQGNIGITGVQGFQGFQGNIGITGVQGFQGFQGNVGVTGAQGFQGFQGLIGITGVQGFQGFQGNVGVTGAQGFQGFQGNIGITGVQGFQGFQGNVGVTGAQGFQGFQGNIGITGIQGFQGFQGFQGPKGSGKYFYGPTAPESTDDGLTLGSKWFNTEVGAEFTYIVEEDDTSQWVMVNVFSATGPQGPAGSGEGSGSQGFQGFQGNIGITGVQGFQGFQGFQGNTGTIGILSDGTNSVNGGQQLTILGGTGIATTVELISSIPTFTVGEIGWQRGGETFPQTLGGIAAGTSFGQGTSLNTILETLLFPYQPVSFASFSIGINGSPFEVGQTAGNADANTTWTTSGPTSNWIANSITISANQNVGTLASGLNYNSSPHSITHGPYKLDSEGTLTFTITGQQEQGSNPSRTTSLNWRYRYFYGKTGPNYDGANLLNQGFTGILTRTTPIDWTMNFSAGSDQAVYVTFPSSEYTGTIRFRDTSTGFLFPFKPKTTFTHTNAHGLNINYDLHESSNTISGALSLKVEAAD